MYDENLYSQHMDGVTQIKSYIRGKCVDVGCGTNPLHAHVLTVDQNPDPRYASADVVHDCKDLDCFAPGTFDTIFSSHCLEDFDDICSVFLKWWGRLKVGGVMVLLLPDMEGGRYPAVGDPAGNPSHHTNVGPEYMQGMLASAGISYTVLQLDTVPHDCMTFDIVIRRDK
jgi:predicted SAM-dependent methyltransferase